MWNERTHELYIHRVAEAFVERYGFVSHQMESYEYHIHFQISELIAEHNPLIVHYPLKNVLHRIEMLNVCIEKPRIKESDGFIHSLRPKECFLRRQTYFAEIYVDLRHRIYKAVDPAHPKQYYLQSEKLYQHVLLYKLPAMRGSSVCSEQSRLTTLRDRGTFIINGYEKCIISQEKRKNNYPYVTRTKRVKQQSFQMEIRAHHAQKIRSTSTLYIHIAATKTDVVPSIYVNIPFIKIKKISMPIPCVVVFRMLGLNDIEDMLHLIVTHRSSEQFKYLARNILHNDHTNTSGYTQDELFNWVGERGSTEKQRVKRTMYVKHIFCNEFLPMCTEKEVPNIPEHLQKAFFFAYSLRILIETYLDERPVGDIDSYKNKRICTAGPLIALQTRQLLRQFFKSVHVKVFTAISKNKFISVVDFFTHRNLTSRIKYMFSTGNWTIGNQSEKSNQTGVCQVINNMTRLSRLSHLRTVNQPLNRDGKQPTPRQLHLDEWGLLCAGETPEGRAVGLLMNASFFTRIRVGAPSDIIIEILYDDLGVLPLSTYLRDRPKQVTKVLVNGIICGFTDNPDKLMEDFYLYRRWHSLPIDSCIAYSHHHIYVNTDSEDAYRPVFNIQHIQKLPKALKIYGNNLCQLWERLLIEGIVIFINKEEEDTLLIAAEYADVLESPGLYTHLEIQASLTIYGLATGNIPMTDSNQSARNIFGSSMGKQNLGPIQLDYNDKVEKKNFTLDYVQKPLVTTTTSILAGFDEMPAGQMCVVGIVCKTGYTQEDSILLNQSSCDRGLFRRTIFQTHRDSEAMHGADIEEFGPAIPGVTGRCKANYDKLCPDTGIVAVGTTLHKHDVIIGKTIEYTHVQQVPPGEEEEEEEKKDDVKSDGKYKIERCRRDRSTLLKNDGPAIVDQVLLSVTKDSMRSATVRTATVCCPEIGDKFASRHGQKGIVGMVVPQEDMVRNSEGIPMDILINCHAIPSRMTIAQLKESFLGKIACKVGKVINGTSFRKIDQDWLVKLGKEFQISQLGKERLYCGKSGKLLKDPVFVGVMTYNSLRHLVQDKLHVRGRGKVQIRTRQPVEGRARDGGFRIGEMERDAITCHGASSVLLDRLLKQSDEFNTVACKTCGFCAEPASTHEKDVLMPRRAYCRYCQSHDNITPIRIPYAFHLLSKELLGCHIGLKFEF